MGRHFLNLGAFSLIELSLVMAVVAILTTAIMPIAVRTIEIKAAEKTIAEVGIIQAGAHKFLADQATWPIDLKQMQTFGYVGPLWNLLNPWGNPYQISSTPHTLTVTTTVPANLGEMLSARLIQGSQSAGVVSSVITTAGINVQGINPGIIVAWSGMIADIPAGWALCDGTNGTPDLRDKFIIGARQDDHGAAKTNVMGALSLSGGNISHQHGGSTAEHALTIAQMPVHDHEENPDVAMDLSNSKGLYGSNPGGHASMFSPRPRTGLSGGGQGHSHIINSDLHIPPYYALAFIMKLT